MRTRHVGARRLMPVALCVGLAAALAVSSASRASFFLDLDPSGGSPGTEVEGRTIGSGSVVAAPNERLPLFLVPTPAVGGVSTPGDPRLVLLGELSVDENGDGATTFTIPEVAPGSYTVLVHCPPCAPSSAGREVLAVGDLLVATAMPSTDTEPPASGALIVGAVVAAAVLVAFVTRKRAIRLNSG